MKRAKVGRPRKNNIDSRGTVMVSIQRRDGGKFAKGTIHRSFVIINAKVSEVAKLVSGLFQPHGD